MKCQKCGKEVNWDEQYCQECKDSMGVVSSNNTRHSRLWDSFVSGIVNLKNNAPLLLANMIMLVLCVFFMFLPQIGVSAFGLLEENVNVYFDVPALGIIGLCLYGFAIYAMVKPLFTQITWTRKNFVPAIVVAIIEIVYLLLVWIAGEDSNRESIYGLAEVGLTWSGWLFLILNVATGALSFKWAHHFSSHT